MIRHQMAGALNLNGSEINRIKAGYFLLLRPLLVNNRKQGQENCPHFRQRSSTYTAELKFNLLDQGHHLCPCRALEQQLSAVPDPAQLHAA